MDKVGEFQYVQKTGHVYLTGDPRHKRMVDLRLKLNPHVVPFFHLPHNGLYIVTVKIELAILPGHSTLKIRALCYNNIAVGHTSPPERDLRLLARSKHLRATHCRHGNFYTSLQQGYFSELSSSYALILK